MAHVSQLPYDGDGVCMLCKAKPSEEEKLSCKTCATPWHAACLAPASRPETLASTAQWECPDCTSLDDAPAVKSDECGDLIAKIQAIMADASLTEEEKAKKRQELMSGKAEVEEDEKKGAKKKKDVLDVLDGIFNCSFCMQLPERPVTVRSPLLASDLILKLEILICIFQLVPVDALIFTMRMIRSGD